MRSLMGSYLTAWRPRVHIFWLWELPDLMFSQCSLVWGQLPQNQCFVYVVSTVSVNNMIYWNTVYAIIDDKFMCHCRGPISKILFVIVKGSGAKIDVQSF